MRIKFTLACVPPWSAALLTPFVLVTPTKAAPDNACAGGCKTARHDSPKLGDKALQAWLEAYQADPAQAANTPLETLLYHGTEVRTHFNHKGTSPLDEAHAHFLQNALQKNHAMVQMRLVSDAGIVIAELKSTRVALGQKAHLRIPATGDLQAFDYSGTVKRVGLNHLWGRF